MRTPTLLITLGAAVVLANSAIGQVQLPQGKLTKLIQLDSMSIEAPSLSPDGRWMTFASNPLWERARSLVIAKVGGGQPRRLLEGDFADESPVWFPSGDRLVFRSSRVDGALMVVGINPSTGVAKEAPRRLTLEAVVAAPAVSPDGRWVAYVAAGTPTAHGALRLIPSAGGNAKTLDTLSAGPREFFLAPTFSADGRSVEYVAIDDRGESVVKSVPVTGGSPRVLFRAPRGSVLLQHSEGRTALWLRATTRLILLNPRGDTVGTANIPNHAGGRTRFIPRSSSLLAISMGGSSEVRVVSTEGSKPRSVGNGYIAGFLTDDRVVVEDDSGSQTRLNVVSLRDGASRRIVPPIGTRLAALTTDGKLLYWRHADTLGVYEIETKKSRVISRSLVSPAGDFASLISSSDEFPYRQRAGDATELRAWSPATNTSRLIRSIPGSPRNKNDFVLQHDLAAYSVGSGDSITVFVAGSPASKPQEVISIRGLHTDGISISRDGRHIVFGIQSIVGSDSTHAIGFADLNADGTLAGKPRMVPVSNVTGVTWLPNGTDVVYGVILPDGNTAMMRLAAREGARPQVISLGEKLHFYDFAASPDGRWVSYPAQQVGPVTLWRVDFPR